MPYSTHVVKVEIVIQVQGCELVEVGGVGWIHFEMVIARGPVNVATALHHLCESVHILSFVVLVCVASEGFPVCLA